MNNKKKKLNKFLSNIMTFAMLFVMLNSGSVFATFDSETREILKDFTNILLTIAGIACVANLIYIGILYMTSSAVDKSNAKSAVLPWLIGTIVCFGASWIGGTIIDVLKIDKDVLSY